MFACRETLLGNLALGDVEADADDADHLAVFIAQRNLRGAHGASLARHGVEAGFFGIVSQGFPQLVRVSSDVVRPDTSRVFAERAPIICQVRMVNETPLVPDIERLEDMIADETHATSA